ncbi:MAG TPA: DUF2382 domain-containing protein [Rhodocyclaceae bacterium]|nr:DUF2382 domain-containing protein [Rhodocyclaceae bacterium]
MVQEEATVSRVVESTGAAVRVRVASHEERQRIPLTEAFDEVSVERVPINRYVSERTGPRQEGEVVIVPVFETVAVVEERLLLKEEVRILRHRREVQRETEVVLRKETPIVERRAPGQEEWREDPPDQ